MKRLGKTLTVVALAAASLTVGTAASADGDHPALTPESVDELVFPGQSVDIEARFTHAEGDIDLYLFDAPQLNNIGVLNEAFVYLRDGAIHRRAKIHPTPSEADIVMTERIAAAADAVGVTLHDHLVIGKSAETSFRADGYI